jgi:hypothetical protein
MCLFILFSIQKAFYNGVGDKKDLKMLAFPPPKMVYFIGREMLLIGSLFRLFSPQRAKYAKAFLKLPPGQISLRIFSRRSRVSLQPYPVKSRSSVVKELLIFA